MVIGSVIVVTHNSGDCIEACLRALVPEKAWKLVLVDNASTDNTVTTARRAAPSASMLLNRENVGFAAAVNQGCNLAEGDIFLLLNPDIIAAPGSLKKLFCAFSQPRTGAVGGLLTKDGRAQTGFTIRRFPTLSSALAEVVLLNRLWPSNPINRHYRCLDVDHTKPQEVEQPAGACLAISKSAFHELGGFDESFFPVWFEDVDFCRRLRGQGWRISYHPEAVFAHTGGHSVGKLTFCDRQSFWYRNLLRYFAKHHPIWQSAILRLGVVGGLLLRSLLSLVGLSPSGVSSREACSAYARVIWNYAVCGRNLGAGEATQAIASHAL